MKKFTALTLVVAMLLGLAACSSQQQEPSATAISTTAQATDEIKDSIKDPAADKTTETTDPETTVPMVQTEEATTQESSEGFDDYAWLGLQDIPKCDYLDTFSTYHYIRTFTHYAMGYKTEKTEAVDGTNTYEGSDNTASYSVNGHIVSINMSAKVYSEHDMPESLVQQAKKNLKTSRENGTNIIGREFVEKGKEAIPQYSDDGDKAEYEYFEYRYPDVESVGQKIIERFYMKDGDVFAIYKEVHVNGDVATRSTEVIGTISGNIPEGVFDVPDLAEYKKV